MINWDSFSSLIGNKRRKYVTRRGQKYLFVCYCKERGDVTVKHILSKRTLIVMPLEHFIEDFKFTQMTNELPLF